MAEPRDRRVAGAFRDRLRARLGVRTTSALAAAITAGIVLCLAGAGLVLGLDALLRMQLGNAATQQATQLGERVAANFAGDEDIKVNAISATGKRTDLVEVVIDYAQGDPDKTPDVQNIGSADVLPQYPLMSDVLVEPGDVETIGSTWVTLKDGTTEEVLVVAKGFEFGPTGLSFTVLAAQPLSFLHRAVETVLFMVLVGIPVLVLLVGGVTYLFAGRALRPVEAMRARVADMTDRDLGQRVPVPASRDEVGRLAETMNQLLGRLEGAQTNQRRFVADASHELRSPLATISSGLELLTAADATDAATVRTLRGEADRLDRLVDGLLLLARSDERGLQPKNEDVDLDEIVEAERGRPSDMDGAGGVAPEVRAEPVRVTGDRAQLVRVVRNLVDNARRHARTRVLVTLSTDAGYAVVEVSDDGPGVAPEDRERVFERFVRLDEARARADGGAGLGLAIVSEIVAAHGGTIEVLDAEWSGMQLGALFRLRLPLLSSAPAARAPELKDDRPTGPFPVLTPEQATVHLTDQVTRTLPSPGEQATQRIRAAREQLTRPVPIRLGEAGSPADLTPTGPIPVVTRREQRDQAGSTIR
jgi:signal transduction histidine kinase